MTPVGRILIIPKDEYISEELYEPLDLVTHNGSCWLCKQTAKGIEPSAENSAYWMNLFTFAIVNNLEYGGENGALDARQGVVLKKMVEEKEVYETVVVSSTEEGKIILPIKEGYSVHSVFSKEEGYTLVGSIGDLYLVAFDKGKFGGVAANKACDIAITYVKKG